MNKKAIMLAGFAVILSGCENGFISTVSTNDLSTPDFNYEIDTWGTNSDVYEFTPKSNAGKTCVFLMLDSGVAMGLQCFDKPTKGKM
jgi:hypothetical protein